MDYFSVFYHGIADVLQEEEQIYKIIDEQCSEIFQIMNSVGLQPTLQGHGYVKKLWSAYGKTSTIVTQINRMRTGLMKVSDKYVEYERKVLTESENIITIKNGFSRSAAKTVKTVSGSEHAKFEGLDSAKKNVWKNAFYEGTIGAWKENWASAKRFLKGSKAVGTEGWSVLHENLYADLENSNLPPIAIGLIKKGIKQTEEVISDYADITDAILNFSDWEHTKGGVLAVASLIDIGGAGAEDALESVFNLAEGSWMERYEEIQQKTGDAVKEGNYIEAAVSFLGGGIETFTKGTVEVCSDWITAQANSKLGNITELFLGKEIKFEDIGEGIAEHTGVNPGTIIADIGSDVSNGVSSALDGFTNWIGGIGR